MTKTTQSLAPWFQVTTYDERGDVEAEALMSSYREALGFLDDSDAAGAHIVTMQPVVSWFITEDDTVRTIDLERKAQEYHLRRPDGSYRLARHRNEAAA